MPVQKLWTTSSALTTGDGFWLLTTRLQTGRFSAGGGGGGVVHVTVTLAGATVMPAAPGFYHRPERIDQLVDFIVARALADGGHLGADDADAQRVEQPLVAASGGPDLGQV